MPLLWVSLAFVSGLVLELLLGWPGVVWLVISFLLLIVAFFELKFLSQVPLVLQIRRSIRVPASVLLLICALGGWRSSFSANPIVSPTDLSWFNDRGEFKLTGWISAPPDRRQGVTRCQISIIEIEDPSNSDWVHAAAKVKGIAQVQFYSNVDWQYGDLLQFYGSPRTPKSGSDFNYREYLASMHIHTVIEQPSHTVKVGSGYGSRFKSVLNQARQRLRDSIFQIYPQPEAGLMAGILLGLDADLPPSLKQAYQNTGVSHIIAISGFNMVILAGLFMWIFTRFMSPYWAALVSGLVLICYAQLVDGSASVIRALIMAIVASGGHLIGRRQEGLNALTFTAALMCAVNPLLIKDISFQLSFSATFGLVVFSQPIQNSLMTLFGRWFSEKWSERLSKPFGDYLFFSLAAQFSTLPVIIYHFGRVSISSLLANPLVLPLQPVVLIGGAVTTMAGLIHPLLGKACLLFSWPVVKYTNWIVELLSKIKGGVLNIHPSLSIWVLVVWAVFLLLFALRRRFQKIFRSSTFVWGVFLLFCGCFTVWSIYLHQPDGKLHLHLQRSGEEVTLYLRSPRGQVWVFDPRGDMNELSSGLERDLSPWGFKVDSALLTQRDGDTALSALAERVPVNRVLLAPTAYGFQSGEKDLVLPVDLTIQKFTSGGNVEIEPGLEVSLVGEDPFSNAILLSYGEERFLIPNGVDYANLTAQLVGELDDLTGLILVPADVSYIPPRVWRQLNPQSVLWADISLSPFDEGLDLQSRSSIELVSDGNSTWLE